MSAAAPEPARPLATRDVLSTWWPLAASWMLMGVEIPTVSAVVARMPDAERALGAFGGMVFPLALLIEAPIIMMLAASTSACRDEHSYLVWRRFMTRLAIALTVLHALVAFTPLYDVIARTVLDLPEPLVEPGRTGLRIMTFWTWAIADRRFHQGVLIRFGRQRLVGIGTLVRLVGTATPLVISIWLLRDGRPLPGIVVAGLGMSSGVVLEMIYVRWCIRAVRRGPLAEATARARAGGIEPPPLELRGMLAFYVPLALTPLIALASQPIGSAGIARLPEPKASFAAWPMITGLAFLVRSAGVAYNEVVVRHAGELQGPRRLGRLAWTIGLANTLIVLAFCATPLSAIWFERVAGLAPDLADLATHAFWFVIPMPLLSYLHSHYQGLLVEAQRTRGITEAVGVFLVVTTAALWIAVWRPVLPAASHATLALTLGSLAQAAWLAWRCRAIYAGSLLVPAAPSAPGT